MQGYLSPYHPQRYHLCFSFISNDITCLISIDSNAGIVVVQTADLFTTQKFVIQKLSERCFGALKASFSIQKPRLRWNKVEICDCMFVLSNIGSTCCTGCIIFSEGYEDDKKTEPSFFKYQTNYAWRPIEKTYLQVILGPYRPTIAAGIACNKASRQPQNKAISYQAAGSVHKSPQNEMDRA